MHHHCRQAVQKTLSQKEKIYQTQENNIPIFKYHLKDNCKYFKAFEM